MSKTVVDSGAELGAPPTGFGSSFVTPISFVSELEGIEDEAPARTKVDLIPECTLDPATTPWQFNASGQVIQGLQGQYFTTPDLSGTPAVTRIDNEVDFNWEQGQIPVSQKAFISLHASPRPVARHFPPT